MLLVHNPIYGNIYRTVESMEEFNKLFNREPSHMQSNLYLFYRIDEISGKQLFNPIYIDDLIDFDSLPKETKKLVEEWYNG
jgi:hypothetical protein